MKIFCWGLISFLSCWLLVRSVNNFVRMKKKEDNKKVENATNVSLFEIIWNLSSKESSYTRWKCIRMLFVLNPYYEWNPSWHAKNYRKSLNQFLFNLSQKEKKKNQLFCVQEHLIKKYWLFVSDKVSAINWCCSCN